MGVHSFKQQTKLTDVLTLKETAARVKEEVQHLASKNTCLKTSCSELTQTTEELKDVEKCLDAITQSLGQFVDALKNQLEENKKILGKKQQNTKREIIQYLTQIVFTARSTKI